MRTRKLKLIANRTLEALDSIDSAYQRTLIEAIGAYVFIQVKSDVFWPMENAMPVRAWAIVDVEGFDRVAEIEVELNQDTRRI